MTDKPHKGSITNWDKLPWYGSNIIVGEFVDHPEFAGKPGHTSPVVKHGGNEIETRNSRYTLVGDERK